MHCAIAVIAGIVPHRNFAEVIQHVPGSSLQIIHIVKEISLMINAPEMNVILVLRKNCA